MTILQGTELRNLFLQILYPFFIILFLILHHTLPILDLLLLYLHFLLEKGLLVLHVFVYFGSDCLSG